MKTLKLILFLVSLSGSLFSQFSSRPVSINFTKSELSAFKSVRELSASLPKDAKIVSVLVTGMVSGKVLNLASMEEQFSPKIIDLLKKVTYGSKIFTDIKYMVKEAGSTKYKNLTLSIRVRG